MAEGMKPYYQDESVTIYNADCRDVLPTLDKVDLVLTDPPYEKEAHTPMRRTRSVIEARSEQESMPFGAITEELREWITGELAAACNGWALTFCQAEAVGKYSDMYGSMYRRPMVWVKPDSAPQFTGDRPAMGYESIIAAWCGDGRSEWNGGGRRGVFTENGSRHVSGHPTEKPVILIRKLIELFWLQGAILDPFMGSGTTLRAAKDLSRKAIGIELEERYCEITANRMSQLVMELN
jgi:site-specific DNA-methyltransferase (adenine-specific)